MSDIYSGSVYVQTKSPCKKRFPSPLKFADKMRYKFKSSQASEARLQSSKHTGAKQNLTQNGHSRSSMVTCFGVSGKAIRD